MSAQTERVLRLFPLLLLVVLAGCTSKAPPPDETAPTSRPSLVPRLGVPDDTPTPSITPAAYEEDAPPREPSAPLTPPASTPAAPFSGPPLARFLPSPPTQRALSGAHITELKAQIARYRLFAAYRELVQKNKDAGFFDEAARLDREQAALYRAKGLSDAAIIADNEASALESQLKVFVAAPTTAQGASDRTTSAINEPVTGCYLGAFIDRDDNLGEPFHEEDLSQAYRAPEQFFAATGRGLGSQFTYLTYGKPFPRAWANRLKRSGTIPHIAWEPTASNRYTDNGRTLGQVRDDAYLRSFAEEVRDFDFPVFIRFASEMNGFWTRSQYGWNGDPKLYRDKFRLVNRVLHEVAPRAATIWCVNNPPLDTRLADGRRVSWLDYYPGDDGCDWVGVNFYAVPFHEDKLSQPAFDENPLALLDPIYRRFAGRKPIAICEFAASHEANVDRVPRPDFAVSRIRLLYGALPLLYPRVKLVDWFDLNTIRYRTPGKTANNYLLTDDARVLRAWRDTTNTPHYLQSFLALGDPIPPVYRELRSQKVEAATQFGVWARNFGSSGTVYLALDGQGWQRVLSNGATYLAFDPLTLPRGRHTLGAFLYDGRGRFQRRLDARFST